MTKSAFSTKCLIGHQILMDLQFYRSIGSHFWWKIFIALRCTLSIKNQANQAARTGDTHFFISKSAFSSLYLVVNHVLHISSSTGPIGLLIAPINPNYKLVRNTERIGYYAMISSHNSWFCTFTGYVLLNTYTKYHIFRSYRPMHFVFAPLNLYNKMTH